MPLEQVPYKKPAKKESKPSPAVGRAMSTAQQRYMDERERRNKNESPVVGN